MTKLAIAVLALVSISVTSILPKCIAQPSSASNATMPATDAIEKLFAKAPHMAMGAGPANYSAWLFVCKAPPITNAEKQCDNPTRLH
jgi:hypothetical protein